MERRRVIFGNYDTALYGPWTVGKWTFPEPDYQSNLVDVPGRDGPLDLSTALTGTSRYGGRTLTVPLECSEGTRSDRLILVQDIINRLDGMRMDIVLPDDPTRFITGRVSVKTNYNDLVHASVTVTAACDPWKYNKLETVVEATATTEERVAALSNTGRRVAIPEVIVTGENASVKLVCGSYSWELEAGSYRLLDLKLKPGIVLLTYSGSGEITIKYREAVL